MSKLLFGIGGIERSGTTLLVAMLSGHPDVSVVDDDEIFLKYDCYSAIHNQEELNEFIDNLIEYHKETEQRGEDFHYNYHGLLEQYQKEMKDKIKFPLLLIDLYPVLLNVFAKKEKAAPEYIGFKTANMLCNPYNYFGLKSSFPQLKFIFIVRDPLIHCAAIMHYRKISAEESVEVIKRFYSREYLSILLNNEFPLIQYESLVEDPETHYNKMISYLGLSKVPFKGTISYTGRESYLGNSISKSKNNERLNQLNERDAEYIRDHTRELSNILGYNKESSKLAIESKNHFHDLYKKLSLKGKLTNAIKRNRKVFRLVSGIKNTFFSGARMWKMDNKSI